MSTLARLARFNLVGAMGIVVQLGSLALLNRVVPGHYLVASAAAVELAILHNFIWHLQYTWRDRRGSSALAQLLRFHLSNGVVSLLGNVLLMRLFVHGAHMPVITANVLAIVCCSVVNFGLSNTWTFALKKPTCPAG